MALSGIALVGFVLAHMVGNLQIFIGAEAINAYAKMLKSMPGLLWVMRLGLIAMVVVHIVSGLRLARLNRAARPERYRRSATIQTGMPARTMALSGLLLLAFIVYHLLHLTLGQTHPEHYAMTDAMGRQDVFGMMVMGFQQAPVAISYIIAMVLLGMHLSHGISSLFQSLGLNSPKYAPMIAKIGPTVAGVIVIGNISMPLAVLAGFIQLGA